MLGLSLQAGNVAYIRTSYAQVGVSFEAIDLSETKDPFDFLYGIGWANPDFVHVSIHYWTLDLMIP